MPANTPKPIKLDISEAKPMTSGEIEAEFERREYPDQPMIIVPTVSGVPFNVVFLAPDEIEPGSIREFLDDMKIGDNVMYYLPRMYRSGYKETKVRILRTL